MTNSARLSGRPSSSAAYNVGDVVDTPDSAIKSWRYLGAGEWEPNDAVRHTMGPGGGVEKFTVSGIRRADGTVAPVLDTGDGWEMLNGWHPRQLFEDGTPGEIFDNRSSLMLKSITAPAISDIAGNGDPVLVRSGTMTPGRAWTALNEIEFSEDFSSWMAVNANVTLESDIYTVTVPSGDGYVHGNIPRTLGATSIYAVEVRPSGANHLFIGPGGAGAWFNVEARTTRAPLGAGMFGARFVDSDRAGWVWCILEREAATASTPTSLRIYPSTNAPTANTPDAGNNTGVGGMQLGRAFYAQDLPAEFLPSRDYNYTNAALPTIAFVGNCCVQLTPESAPIKNGLLLDFAGGKSMNAVFQTAPGANTTVGRAVPGLGAQIETASVGVEMPVSASDAALVVIGRALTGPERTQLRDWLTVRAQAAEA